MTDPVRPRRPPARSTGAYMGAGLQLVVPILLCLFGGRWLDGRLGTGPWLMLAGVVAGFAAGFLSLFRALGADARRDRP
jgi:ATP synthase protein I